MVCLVNGIFVSQALQCYISEYFTLEFVVATVVVRLGGHYFSSQSPVIQASSPTDNRSNVLRVEITVHVETDTEVPKIT